MRRRDGWSVVWQDATAVRRRVLVRVSASGGAPFGPARVLSSTIKAFAPDVAVAPDGRFLVAWHEERFPSLYTVIEPLAPARPTLTAARSPSPAPRPSERLVTAVRARISLGVSGP